MNKQASKYKKEYYKIKKQIEVSEIDYVRSRREIDNRLDFLEREYIRLTGLTIKS